MSMNFPFDHDQPEWADTEWTEAESEDKKSPMDFDLMMSMALDDLLDEDESAQFYADIEYYPLLAEQWATWQELDEKLMAEPSVMPPSNFVQNFERRLSKEQRRSRFWLGASIAAVTLVLWASIILGTLSAGAYIAVNQNGWVNDQIHSVAHLLHSFTAWIQSTASAANVLLGAVAASPPMWGIALAYMALMGGILVYWTRLLRRSMSDVSMSEVTVTSA